MGFGTSSPGSPTCHGEGGPFIIRSGPGGCSPRRRSCLHPPLVRHHCLSVRPSVRDPALCHPPARAHCLTLSTVWSLSNYLLLDLRLWRAGQGLSVPPGPVLGPEPPSEGPGSLALAWSRGGAWPPSRGARPGPPGMINAAPAPCFSQGLGGGRCGCWGGTAPLLPSGPGECLSYRSQTSLVPASICSDISGVYLLLLVSQ